MDEAETEMKYDSEEMGDVEEKKQMNDQGNDAAEDPLAAVGLEDCDADDDVVLSMSRLGGAGAVAQLVADVPLSSVAGGGGEGGDNQTAWEKWSSDGTKQQVAKLMEEDVGAAMQFLQSKALCIMPVSLASAIYHMHQSDTPTIIKPEPNAPS